MAAARLPNKFESEFRAATLRRSVAASQLTGDERHALDRQLEASGIQERSCLRASCGYDEARAASKSRAGYVAAAA